MFKLADSTFWSDLRQESHSVTSIELATTWEIEPLTGFDPARDCDTTNIKPLTGFDRCFAIRIYVEPVMWCRKGTQQLVSE